MARRDGYKWTGEDGIPIPEKNGEKGDMFEGVPAILKPMYNMEGILKRCLADCPESNIDLSDDGGLAFCEFGFYNSLAALHRRREPARAVYMHVPKMPQREPRSKHDEDIQQGARVAVALIKAMLEQ